MTKDDKESNKETGNCENYNFLCYFANDNKVAVMEAMTITNNIVSHSQFSIFNSIVGVAAYLIYCVGSIRSKDEGEDEGEK